MPQSCAETSVAVALEQITTVCLEKKATIEIWKPESQQETHQTRYGNQQELKHNIHWCKTPGQTQTWATNKYIGGTNLASCMVPALPCHFTILSWVCNLYRHVLGMAKKRAKNRHSKYFLFPMRNKGLSQVRWVGSLDLLLDHTVSLSLLQEPSSKVFLPWWNV